MRGVRASLSIDVRVMVHDKRAVMAMKRTVHRTLRALEGSGAEGMMEGTLRMVCRTSHSRIVVPRAWGAHPGPCLGTLRAGIAHHQGPLAMGHGGGRAHGGPMLSLDTPNQSHSPPLLLFSYPLRSANQLHRCLFLLQGFPEPGLFLFFVKDQVCPHPGSVTKEIDIYSLIVAPT